MCIQMFEFTFVALNMDLLSFLDVHWLLLATVLLIGTYMYLSWPYNYFKKLGVPGPTPIPGFGVWKDLIYKNINHMDEELISKYGKVFGFYEGWTPAVMAADPELVKDVTVKLSSVFCDRREILWLGPLKHSQFHQAGTNWKRLRSLSTPLFTAAKLKKNSKRISAVLTHVTQSLEEKCFAKTQIEAKEFANEFAVDVICNVVFGVDTNTRKEKEHPLTIHSKAVVMGYGPKNPWLLFSLFCPAIARVFDRFDVSVFKTESIDYITHLCRTLLQQKEQGNKDAEIFVTALVKAHEEELDHENKQALGQTDNIKYKGMTETEIIAQAFLFVFAGYETTATTLGFLLHALTLNQSVQQTLYEEIQNHLGDQPATYDNVQDLEYLSWCVDETLRMYPPIPRLDRLCTAEDGVTVAGVPLKKGHIAIIPIWHLHHQPDVWPEPYKFDPLRFSPKVKEGRHPYSFFPFGVGPRNCIGVRLALLEIKMFIITVLQQFKLVPNCKTVPVDFDLTFFTTAKDGLWFSVEKRQ